MTEKQQLLVKHVDKHRKLILDAERWLWQHPETGYKEWQSHQYLKDHFEALGYPLTLAGNIPGFFTDVDTGLPGPTLCIMAELDALDIANHPESVNGMCHCCGHHGQGAAMLGIAAALKEPGALDGLCGKIRLMVVPAEEMIQLDFRENLRKQGVIQYFGGKTEFMHRGYLDGVDLSIMVHGNTAPAGMDFYGNMGGNGCIAKTFLYKGKSSHAGGAPHLGVNAQYAATLGLNAVNALRETFRERDAIRFHPIMKGVDVSVNIIPDRLELESYVRGRTLEAMKRENTKINRALTGAALSMGAELELHDRPGYAPEQVYVPMLKLIEKCCTDLAGAEHVHFDYNFKTTASTDFGDVTCVMPGIMFYASGAAGTAHGIDYQVVDPERLCVGSAKAQLFAVNALLSDNASEAHAILEGFQPKYPTIAEYLAAIDEFFLDKEAVRYNTDGSVQIDFL